MRRAILASVLLCGGLCFALVGCSHGHGGSVTVGTGEPHASHGHHHDHGHGPPPHAPAHGYRKKHKHEHGHDDHHHHGGGGNVEMVFDSDLGVYVVVGLPHHFFWDGVYLRVDKGRWYASARLDGGWEPCASDALPPGLRKKTAKGKGKKNRGPAKAGW